MESDYMIPESQRIAIAEACGWTRREPDNLYPEVRWLDPKNTSKWRADYAVKVTGLPDYLNDLNAMHEAEMTLYQKGLTHDPYGKVGSYIWELGKVTAPDGFLTEAMLVHATAAQRAEAFPRTLSIWKD